MRFYFNFSTFFCVSIIKYFVNCRKQSRIWKIIHFAEPSRTYQNGTNDIENYFICISFSVSYISSSYDHNLFAVASLLSPSSCCHFYHSTRSVGLLCVILVRSYLRKVMFSFSICFRRKVSSAHK